MLPKQMEKVRENVSKKRKEFKIRLEQGVFVQTAGPGCHSEHLVHGRVDVWAERELESFLLATWWGLSVETKAALILWYLEGPDPIWALSHCWHNSAIEVPFPFFARQAPKPQQRGNCSAWACAGFIALGVESPWCLREALADGWEALWLEEETWLGCTNKVIMESKWQK